MNSKPIPCGCKTTPVRITEICPRDGFQNIKAFIPTAVKIAIIDRLIAAGARTLEITSMVSPKAIPQMADAADIIDHVSSHHPQVTPVVLVPNLKGAQRAHRQGIRHVSYVVSVSPAHNRANINRTHDESLADLAAIVAEFPDIQVVLTLATAFGCPFIGATSTAVMLSLIDAAVKMGIRGITLCDAIGVANPLQTERVLQAIRAAFPALDIGMHMHNTHGMALANMLVGLALGITRFETANGGLGGCPFAPGAAGNIATEDAVNMFQRMGYQTGYDLGRLIESAKTIQRHIEPNLTGSLVRSRDYREFDFIG